MEMLKEITESVRSIRIRRAAMQAIDFGKIKHDFLGNQTDKTFLCLHYNGVSSPLKDPSIKNTVINCVLSTEGIEILGFIASIIGCYNYDLAKLLMNFLGIMLTWTIMIWNLYICLSGTDSPVGLILTGSMEPGFKRGDYVFIHMNNSPIRAGEIVVFNVELGPIPIVHRVIKVHERRGTGEVSILTKGDNNYVDDRFFIYADGQLWLEQNEIIGRVFGYVPHVGWVNIKMAEWPLIKYLLISVLCFLLITLKKLEAQLDEDEIEGKRCYQEVVAYEDSPSHIESFKTFSIAQNNNHKSYIILCCI